MKECPHRLAAFAFAVALALCGLTFAWSAEAALAQTSPELEFLNGPITQRATQGDQGALDRCPPQFDAYAETASATAFVLLSGAQDATDVEFETEVPSAGSTEPDADEGFAADSYEQLVVSNRLTVDPDPAPNERDDLSVQPSEVKAFVLTFSICSDSRAPAWWSYIWRDSVPVEWSNFSGQLVVSSTGDPRITPGTVPLQLNRPAPGHEGTTFSVIFLIFVVSAGVMALVLLLVGRGGRHDNTPKDWRTGLVIPSTTGAAVLGTLFTATILPSDTFFMSKGQYATLNALFGLTVVFVGLLYGNVRRRSTLLIGAGIALGAGTGEALTAGFILREMAFQGSLPVPYTLVLQIALLLGWVALAVLASRARLRSEGNGQTLPGEESGGG
jgi:hypothetical protein